MSRLERAVASWPSIVILLLIVFLPVYGPYAGSWEGQVFPVVRDGSLLATEAQGDGTTRFRLALTKVRECEFTGLRLDINGVTVPTQPASLGTTLTLPVGRQISRAWIAEAPTLDNAMVWLTYRCHPFWITVTRVV